MKKYFITVVSVILTAAFALGFAACGGSGSPAKSVDVIALADDISANCTFEDTGLEKSLDSEFTIKSIYGCDPALIAGEEGQKKVSVYITASCEMIICIEAVDAASAQKLMDESLKPMLDIYINEYTTYQPADVNKLKTAVKIVEGNYVVVVVSADNAQAETYVMGRLGK